jgi:acetoacetyl-CoA synthetase
LKTPLWTPSEETIRNANITRFLDHVNKKQGKKFRTYWDLYQWSIENIPEFWARMWEFVDI